MNYRQSLDKEEMHRRQKLPDAAIQYMGITFKVYPEEGNIDRLWPFDIIPKTISAKQQSVAEKRLMQRLEALNLCNNEVYNGQCILNDNNSPPH
ncbi:MAG: putative circularly permuted ATP-grasp superfamily protein [Candidatus Endobugula sp.]|jgi:uncharacterized circularly permuted ATP-grasp superfamily protein